MAELMADGTDATEINLIVGFETIKLCAASIATKALVVVTEAAIIGQR